MADTVPATDEAADPDLIDFSGDAQLHQSDDVMAVRQAVDTREMTATFVLLTTAVNDHGNAHQITATAQGQGLILDQHQRAPIVMFEHGFRPMGFPVIGVSQDMAGNYSVRKSEKNAIGTVWFSDSNPDGPVIFAMVEQGLLRMASIGFRPIKGMLLAQSPPEALPQGVEMLQPEGRGILFTETMLTEWSIVARGADPGAFRQLAERGSINGYKVSQSMSSILQHYAEPPQTQGVGLELPKIALPEGHLSVTLQGPADAIQSVVQTLQKPVRQTATAPAPAAEPDTVAITPQTVTQTATISAEETSALVRQKLDATLMPTDISSMIRQLLAKEMATQTESIMQLATDQAQRLRTATGAIE